VLLFFKKTPFPRNHLDLDGRALGCLRKLKKNGGAKRSLAGFPPVPSVFSRSWILK
jgi:hypothetical protein